MTQAKKTKRLGRPKLAVKEKRIDFSTKVSADSKKYIDRLQKLIPGLRQGRAIDLIIEKTPLESLVSEIKMDKKETD